LASIEQNYDPFKSFPVAGDREFELFIAAMNDRLSSLRLFRSCRAAGQLLGGGRELNILNRPFPA